MSKKMNSILLGVLMLSPVFVPTHSQADESVKGWVGIVEDYFDSHEKIHEARSGDHPLKFTRSSDGKVFTIVEGGGALLREHLEADKTLLVEVDGRITSKFLFFGGNMIISDAKVIQQMAQVEHRTQRRFERSDNMRGAASRR